MKEFKIDLAFVEYRKNLELLNSLSLKENEDTTRLKAIDTILFDVLDWDKECVITEKYCREEGYADYVFNINSSPYLVLEAKKSGTYFLLPERKYEDRPYAFGILGEECPEAKKALLQAIGYASILGASYVGISNGHQWLFTLAYTQGQPLDQRLVYTFSSFKVIEDRFSTFCNCFSMSGLFSNSVRKNLLDTLRHPAPAKFSNKISGYPIPSSRNIYQNELTYILDFVWQSILQDESTFDFIGNCYVNPHSHEDILSIVKEMIIKRRNEDNILIEYEIESSNKLPYQIANIPSEKPIAILGEVGRGKTSFLKYLRFISAKEALKEYIQIEINFLDKPDNHQEIGEFVFSEIEKQLQENYSIEIYDDNFVRGVLHSDIHKLKKTPRGKFLLENKEEYKKYEILEIERMIADKHFYFTKLIHHLKKGRGHSIALFFDNLDRRTPEIQENAYLKASSIARDWSCLVFICLRPTTFYTSQKKGVLDSIAPITFTVGQPDLSLVLKRRFAYAKKIADGEQFNQSVAKSVPSRNVAFYLPSVSKLFESCEFSATKRNGIIPMLEDVSNGNIRRLLDFVKKIICSGHLDTNKIIEIIEKQGYYFIPDFEGIKALLFGDYIHYDSTISPFINLFDIQNSDRTEHFIRIAILNYLSKFSLSSTSFGFVKRSDLTNYLSSIDYNYILIDDTIKYLTDNQCIKNQVDSIIELSETDKIKLTTLGKYHLFSLVRQFQYIDSIIIDTPIIDDETRIHITDSQDIKSRISRTESFIKYLDSCSLYIKDVEVQKLWEEISISVKENMKSIKEKVGIE